MCSNLSYFIKSFLGDEINDFYSVSPKIVLICCSLSVIIYACMVLYKPLWCDELIMLITVRRPFIEGIFQLQDYSAPLYQLILRVFIHDDFAPEWVVRAPAFFCAIFSLISIWWLAKTLFNRRAALITTALIAINPCFTFYAAEGRPYTMFMLFSVLSMGTFYLTIIRGKFNDFLLYVISTVTLIYSHYYGFLVLISQFAYLLIDVVLIRYEKGRAIKVALSYTAILILVTPALFLVSRYILDGTPGVFWIKKPGIIDLIWPKQVGELFGDVRLGVIIMGFLLISILQTIKPFNSKISIFNKPYLSNATYWWSNNKEIILCVLWVISSMFLLIWISFFVKPIYHMRYALPAIVPFTMVFVIMTNRLPKYFQLITLLVVICLMVPNTARKIIYFLNDYPKLVCQLKKLNKDNREVFVTNWAYCENFISPELWGLKYYGYTDSEIKSISWNYPYEKSIRDHSQFPIDKSFFVVAFAGKEIIAKYFQQQPRALRVNKFRSLNLIEVEKQFEYARWLKEQNNDGER